MDMVSWGCAYDEYCTAEDKDKDVDEFKGRLDTVRDLRDNGFLDDVEYANLIVKIVEKHFPA